MHGIGCSRNLKISYLLFLESMGKGLLSMGKQSIRKTCRCRATCCYKKPELLGWDPPPPPLNKHNRFQYTVPSHIKSCTAHWWEEGGPRQKARLFVTEGIYGKESPDSISKSFTHDCGVGIYLYYIRCQYPII